MSAGPGRARLSFDDFNRDSDSEEEVDNFTQYTVMRAKRRKERNNLRFKEENLSQAETQRTSTVHRRPVALHALQFLVNLLALIFVATASLGAVLHAIDIYTGKTSGVTPVTSSPETDGKEDDDINWDLAREAATLAFLTSWQAIKLWSRLLVSIIVPTSHKTFLMTREGFIALQPSLETTWVLFQRAPRIAKLSLGGAVLGLIIFLYLFKEAKRRRYAERAANTYYFLTDYVSYKYENITAAISKRSFILASHLSHVLFLGFVTALHVLVPDLVSVFSKGFFGWFIVVAAPVMLSTKALIVYDKKYNERIITMATKKRKPSVRRMSQLPTADGLHTKITGGLFDLGRNLYGTVTGEAETGTKQKQKHRQREESMQSEEEEEMRPYLTLKNKKHYKTMRGIRPLEYPKILDEDDVSALEQKVELSEVVSWLKYWLLLAPMLVVEELPITSHVISLLPFWPSARLFFSIWLQFPATNGTDLAFDIIVPLVAKYWQAIELNVPGSPSTNYLGKFVIDQLPISKYWRRIFSEISDSGGPLLFSALPFFIMPSFVTSIGCVLIGLLKPMYSGIVSVLSVETAAYAAKRRLAEADTVEVDIDVLAVKESRMIKKIAKRAVIPTELTVASASLHCTHWLEYWVVYTLFMFTQGLFVSVLYWVPFWSQMQLAVLLFLQLPYFRGARTFFKRLLRGYYALKKRFFGEEMMSVVPSQKRARREKKRKRLGRVEAKDPTTEIRQLGGVSFRSINEIEESALKEIFEETAAPAERLGSVLPAALGSSDQELKADKEAEFMPASEEESSRSGYEQAIEEEKQSTPPSPRKERHSAEKKKATTKETSWFSW